jgi:hypothetical protein
MSSESIPSTTAYVEGVPGRGAAQDGAWTDPAQDGAWTEPPLDGAYTQDNAYEKEFKPMTTFTAEGVPS